MISSTIIKSERHKLKLHNKKEKKKKSVWMESKRSGCRLQRTNKI